MRAGIAGLSYFGLIFVLGAMFGPLRLLVLRPLLGAVPAVLLELPFMLAASWFVCSWLIGQLKVPGDGWSRLTMGGIAFILLMAAELALTVFAAGGTVASHLAAYRSPQALLGLTGQFAFALIPLAARRSSRTAP